MQLNFSRGTFSQKPPLPKPRALQTRASLLASEEAQQLKKAIGKGHKQQGLVVPSSARTKPSSTHSSQELQAGSRVNQERAISNLAEVQESGKRSSHVSIENASTSK